MNHNGWFKELPQENGDYIWITYWSCYCCIRRVGIGYIDDYCEENYPNGLTHQYKFVNSNGEPKIISWEGSEPPWRDSDYLDITCWKKLDKPDFEIFKEWERSDRG